MIKPAIRRKIASLTLEELWQCYLVNPCYLPLLADTSFWNKGARIGYKYEDLFNDLLPPNHPFKNRYLVGDFNVLDTKGENRKLQEVFPKLNLLKEFKYVPKDLLLKMDSIEYKTPEYAALLLEIRSRCPELADVYINFLEKVWNYRLVPIKREFSVNGNSVYAAGQIVVLCEACDDTLRMLAKFAVSSKRMDITLKKDSNGKNVKSYFEYLPIGQRRGYYAGLNRITSKNWETERHYSALDSLRDVEVGGGNSRITFYEGKVELPNFLLIEPSKEDSMCIRHNGIHKVALLTLARGMLGTGNSIGCIRVTDFGSKFIRWWVPQECKFFIAYNDNRFHKKIDSVSSVLDYLPFKTQAEGDSFRVWMNTYKSIEAIRLELEPTGDFRNGYIIDAYYFYKDDYKHYLNTQSTPY